MLADYLSLIMNTVLVSYSVPLGAGVRTPTARRHDGLLSAEERSDLLMIREEAKLARDIDLTFYGKRGLSVFSNIASSEQQLMEGLARILDKYRLPDPAAGHLIGEFSSRKMQEVFNTLVGRGQFSDVDALKIGGMLEEADIQTLHQAMERAANNDVEALYTRLLHFAREHLKEFAASLEQLTGRPYKARILSQDTVDSILGKRTHGPI